MRDAVIVSTARTPIGKAYRGAFNVTKTPVLMAHAIKAAIARAGLEGGEIEDFAMGSALTPRHRGRRHHRPAMCLGPLGHRPRCL